MNSYFNSDFFAGNRKRLKELFTGTAPIVVTANGLLQKGGDSSFAFAQDANFWYLTGLDEPDLVLVMDKEQEYLIVPTRSASRQAFDGVLDQKELAKTSGVKTILDEETGWQRLVNRLKKVKHVATIAAPPAYIDTYGIYTNPARAKLAQRLKKEKTDLELLDLGPHISRLRMIKQQVEIDAIQQAIDITIASMKNTFTTKRLKRYAHEYEIEAEIAKGFRSRGAHGHAFAPIVASGKRACTLHYVENNGQLSADEILVADVGAEVEHYAADITRTVALGKPTPRQKAVHAAVLEVQDYAFSLLKPGVLLREYEQLIENFMGQKLIDLGLIKKIEHEAVRQYFPHATSHYLGLNVHDVGDYDRPLEPGVVLTVEPGIYIADEAIGVRIEDDVLITKTGIKILSRKLSRQLH